jgi:hypothetical protein
MRTTRSVSYGAAHSDLPGKRMSWTERDMTCFGSQNRRSEPGVSDEADVPLLWGECAAGDWCIEGIQDARSPRMNLIIQLISSGKTRLDANLSTLVSRFKVLQLTEDLARNLFC